MDVERAEKDPKEQARLEANKGNDSRSPAPREALTLWKRGMEEHGRLRNNEWCADPPGKRYGLMRVAPRVPVLGRDSVPVHSEAHSRLQSQFVCHSVLLVVCVFFLSIALRLGVECSRANRQEQAIG